MPLIRLLIFISRGIGGIFRAFGRMFRALFSAGVFSFLVKSFEALLRLTFVGSLVTAGVVCWRAYAERPFVDRHYAAAGMPCTYKVNLTDAYGSYAYERASLGNIVTHFVPKDPNVAYGPGRLDPEALMQVWNNSEMVHVSGRAVEWQTQGRALSPAGGKPMLKPEDFAPSTWEQLAVFFTSVWAALAFPLIVAWLVFPSVSRLRDRIHRACLLAPLWVIVSFSFAYLLTLHWLSVQHEAAAEWISELPAWVHPSGLLNEPLMKGMLISLMPVVAWYLLRWVLGPFFRSGAVTPTP